MKTNTNASYTHTNKILLFICMTLLTACLALTVSLLYVIYVRVPESEARSSTAVPTLHIEKQHIISDEPINPPVFHDLTKQEVKAIQAYLYKRSGLNLVYPTANKKNSSFIFTMELYLPNKTDVLNYLDHKGQQPEREAIVTIFQAYIEKPEINEIIVGPLPTPTSHRPVPGRRVSIPYFYRPVTPRDYGVAMEYLTSTVDEKLSDLLMDAYGARLINCGESCLAFRYISQFSPASSGVNVRKFWYWMNYFVEFYILNPVDFSVLVTVSSDKFEIDSIWFNGIIYKSLDELAMHYKKRKLKYNRRKFPRNDRNLFSKLTQRGHPPKLSNRRDPIQFYPDGPRYEVKHRHVSYMDWEFDFRLSTSLGPQVYDIRFRGDRIAYEISLQEISVFYSGHSPHQKFSDYLDSSELIGPSAKGLIPGVDCPDHATFVSAHFVKEDALDPETTETAFCVFEWNTGEPLRRHYSKSSFDGAFYEGMQKTVLILRTALKIANYDYITDFRFYTNGVLEVKAISTGYILANAFSPEEEPFAFQLHNYTAGNYHLHLFNFKADLDIMGVTNRYETIDISTMTEANPFSDRRNATYTQGKIKRNLKLTEKDATFRYNFDYPKYHVFYNKKNLNAFGNPRSYRYVI